MTALYMLHDDSIHSSLFGMIILYLPCQTHTKTTVTSLKCNEDPLQPNFTPKLHAQIIQTGIIIKLFYSKYSYAIVYYLFHYILNYFSMPVKQSFCLFQITWDDDYVSWT